MNIDHVDFIKIDTQGAELEIIKGLGDYRPLLLWIEVQFVSMYKDMPCFTELYSKLYELGYMICDQNEFSARQIKTPVEADVLFIPNILTKKGQAIIANKEREFAALMIMFGQDRALKLISNKLEFSFLTRRKFSYKWTICK